MSTYLDRTPYTYFIAWTDKTTNLIVACYYGVRYSKNCHPDDLWITYFTSSEYVQDYRELHGKPDIIQVRKIFVNNNNVSNALAWEEKVLRRMKSVNSPVFLNRGNSGKSFYVDPLENSINTKKQWEDPEFRILVSKSASAQLTAQWKDSEFRNSMSLASSIRNTGHSHPRFDHTVYSFEHKDGSIENLTRYDMKIKYNLRGCSITEIIKGRRKSYAGWKLISF